MEKLTQSKKKESNLNIKVFHKEADNLKNLLIKQLMPDQMHTNLFRSTCFQHDDNSEAYVIQYILDLGKKDYPQYYLSFYGNEESDLVIPFLGIKGENRAITIFNNQELNNIPKIMYELIEAKKRPCMYDVEFDFDLEKNATPAL